MRNILRNILKKSIWLKDYSVTMAAKWILFPFPNSILPSPNKCKYCQFVLCNIKTTLNVTSMGELNVHLKLNLN